MSAFEYLSVYLSIVVGLGVVHLLTSVGRIVGNPQAKLYWVHLLWIATLLLFITYFWWFSFEWQEQGQWTFNLFLFLLSYAMMVYLLAVILAPLSLPEDGDYERYFYERSRFFFGLWAFLYVVDLADAFMKGPDNLERLGPTFLPIWAAMFTLYVVAALTKNRRYHAAFAVLIAVWQLVNIRNFGAVLVS